jgi:hypothetical protein
MPRDLPNVQFRPMLRMVALRVIGKISTVVPIIRSLNTVFRLVTKLSFPLTVTLETTDYVPSSTVLADMRRAKIEGC